MDDRGRGITRFGLQIIAYTTMIIDHLGYAIVPYILINMGIDDPQKHPLVIIMREIGRIAFPIFVFMMCEGMTRTHSRIMYMVRILILGIISFVPYSLMVARKPVFWGAINVLSELLLGALLIVFIDWINSIHKLTDRTKTLIIAIAALLLGTAASYFKCEYGIMGIGLTAILYLCKEERYKMVMYSTIWIFIGYMLDLAIIKLSSGKPVDIANSVDITLVEMCAVGGILLISLYNGKKGKTIPKAVTYAIYPVHLLALYFLRLLLL